MDTTPSPADRAKEDGVPEIITTSELSTLTGWSDTTILRWVADDLIPVIRKVGNGRTGGTYLFSRDVLNRIRPKRETDALVDPQTPPSVDEGHVTGQLPLPAR